MNGVRNAFLLAGLLGSLLAQATGPQPERTPSLSNHPPRPHLEAQPLMRAPEAERPIRLVAAEVRTTVAGTLARTRLSLTFLNENRRPLEGELQFPLADGQSVTDFALESLDGQMLPAVAVKKSRGQEVFEAIERRNVDPALLEKTLGNSFKLRVYPLPPGKTRRVSLEITELLSPGQDGRVEYRWPLRFTAPAPYHLVFQAELHGIEASRVSLPSMPGLQAVDRHGDATVWLDQADFRGMPGSGPRWSVPNRPNVLAESFAGESYFHAEIPVEAAALPRPRPRTLALVWDASGSGAQRDHGAEFALLDAYFRHLGDVTVHLVVARDRAEAAREFPVRSGDWTALRQTLASLPYDGASNPAAWLPDPGRKADLALLFSDGVGTWGNASTGRLPVPLFTVSSATAANPDHLRVLAERSGGAYLDLLEQDTAQALAELTTMQPAFHTAHVSGLDELAMPTIHPRNGRLRIAGRLVGKEGILNYSLRMPDGRFLHRQIRIPGAAGPESDLAAKLWAGYRIAQLEADPATHQAEIERMGSQFGLVTSQTSLLVLETLEDFLRYRVMPPPGPLRTAYLEHAARTATDSPAALSRHLDDLANRFAQMVKWWETVYPKGTPPKEGARDGQAIAARAERNGHAREVRRAPAVAAMPAPLMMARAAPAEPAATPAGSASIHLQKWQPNGAFARRLREADAGRRYAVYLDERPGHRNSTAFFLDAADIFFEKGQADLAVRILSNLAEMDLENRHILRILAYRLNQAGMTGLSLPLLKRVRKLAPEEPQSWRDLGLALAADGQPQAALEALWETVSRPWDPRFADVDLIALAELNALVARTPGLDTGAIDRRLLRNLPLDVRVVLAWDADNTDMDLWVIDPNGEKTFYARPLSYQGGKLSRDFTAGYGPEAFSLKQAKPGRYEVRVQFYGHRQQVLSPYTTLMLRLTTDFGRPGQKDENIVLRLTEAKEDVLVGSFEVAPRP